MGRLGDGSNKMAGLDGKLLETVILIRTHIQRTL
jgi:hypothetical protein